MMGHLHHSGRRRTISNASSRSNRSSVDESKLEAAEDVEVVEPDQGNVLSHIISQLRPGADLSRVVLPTFILEPRSMLERITNFMCHPEMLLPIPGIDDPVQRFAAVVKFYLSGWHIRPPGVKKPLNPILGEIFTCYWDLPDKTRAYYVSEQTSHHPPKSSYFYMIPDHQIRIDGTLKPRSKFLGNSAASLMEGTAILSLLSRKSEETGKPERYILTQPNMYARGILFGKMKYELGDHSIVRCPELGLVADIEFKVKGWVAGTYNAIGGCIKNERTGEQLFELSGLWSEEMFIRDIKTGHKEMFFNALRAKPSPPLVRPIEEQEERESQRLWLPTVKAVKARNHELATDEKTKVEDMQREEAAKRAQDGVEWRPRLFRAVKGGKGGIDEGEEDLEWIINAAIDDSDPETQAEQIKAIYPIIKGQKSSEQNTIPPHTANRDSAKDLGTETEKKTNHTEDLIDFGSDEPSNLQAPLQPTTAGPTTAGQSQSEISKLLNKTGEKPSDGPLIDFGADLGEGLPKVKRADTAESHDEFHDAQS